jgi:small subunit ribosomal protein S16
LSVKIRLTRTGRKKICRYRIVVADSRMARDGRFLESLGIYNPQSKPKEFTIDADRVAHWLKQGAEASETVYNLLKQDRFFEKLEGMGKGIPAEQLNLERKAETVKKPKKRKTVEAK